MTTRARERGVIGAAVLGSGIVFLDSTIVTVALARIGQDLPSEFLGVLEAQSFVYNGYLLSLSALLILAGAVTDRLGRRRVFTWGLVGFGVTSAMCGLAPTMEVLIAGRVLQGAAGALLVPGSLAILTSSFQGEARGRAFGVWAGTSAITSIVGPGVGGVLVDAVSWRAAFLVNIPLIAVGVWATRAFVEESRDPEAGRHFDRVGAALLAVAVGGLVFGLIRGQEVGWESPLPIVVLVIGALAAIATPIWIARARDPLVPRHLFESRNFVVTNVSTFLIYGAIYVFSYIISLYLQGTVGYNATAAGLATTPSLVFLAVFSSRFGERAAVHGVRRYMAAGPLVMGLGLLWLVRLDETSTPWRIRFDQPSTWLPGRDYLVDILPAMVVYGLGLMVLVAPLTTALMGSVPERNSGVASAFNNAVSRIGPQIIGAVWFIVVTAVFTSAVASEVPGVTRAEIRAVAAPLNPPIAAAPEAIRAAADGASTRAFRVAMVLTAALLVAGAVVNQVGIRNHPVVPPGEPPPTRGP